MSIQKYFFPEKISSDQIVESIKQRNNQKYKSFEKSIQFLYQHYFPKVKFMVLKMSGNELEAEDVFQEAITKVIWSIDQGNFQGKSHISTYLYTIAKNMWLKTLERRKREQEVLNTELYPIYKQEDIVDALPDIYTTAEEEEQDLDQVLHFKKLLDKIGDDCRNILKCFYFKELSYDQILDLPNNKYASEQVIRNKKSRCLKYLRKGLQDFEVETDKLLDYIKDCL
ncbi:RNA polymerase sigma factor [Sediminitomix flava]|uniref:RNA polymerase sigma factor (Sigma-70 family) n=1 Tax=Sediminitomix flava TaxID=379075 RepID=A0A315Z4L6_SEDFL|nr:sigma-70 family RNA polymerase sigma factor [Sediminitomix flava]PWJ38024.1 RNA polymerase sigma factor (sigma-70 family) [Sediminitomix flava]